MSSPVRPTAPAAPSGHVLSRGRRRLVPVFVLAAVLGALALVEQPTLSAHGESTRQAKASEVGLLTRKTPDAEVRTGPEREVGMRFKAKVAGTAVGVRYYKPRKSKASTPASATLWSKSGKVLARTKLGPVKGKGWKKVGFDSGVKLAAGKGYVVSVHTGAKGIHAATPGGWSKAKSNAQLRAPGDSNGVTRPGSKARFPSHEARGDANYWVDVRFVPADAGTTPAPTPTATPTTPPPGGWPGPDNTGVPAGTTLAPYTGPCTITSARTISGADVLSKCSDALVIQTTGVVIEKSLVPGVWSIYGDGDSSVSITDSDVRAGSVSTAGIWGYNITARRVDVTGGQHSFQCNNNCEVTDSWLHDQYNPDGGSFHNNAFISNGGHTMVIRHNTLHCTAILNSNDGGCSGDLSLFGDFDPIDDVTIDNNYLRANNSSISYCLYGGASSSKPYEASNVRVTNNVFERGANRKCGVYGPVTSFDRNAAGNQWSGNVWDSGEAVNP
ncbi:DUF4082 domain-containing protein [Nocardioides cavernae]|uniref:DUF4082 domain-containing protein n=1 Tax=Nocardioides cavernae TaxID=1921566 RepID=A0ABR8N4N6_9ACTN|nr:DUF4082 domain-containing protein [Nocardioides cavernae]MBD3923133.1 DUF4082 domain-containing protein [Nocardioides cavernae]MBM7511946.1 hypothetical protein [Nocardioides cavernae]